MRALGLATLASLIALPAMAAAPVDYVRDVKPILARHCYKCHGAREQKSDLRLDTAASALQGGQRGPAIIPGNAPGSRLVQAVKGEVPELGRMPLKMSPLETPQIELIARWINEGAKAPADEQPEDPFAAGKTHWAFIPPKRPAVPEVQSSRLKVEGSRFQPTNPIDAFILARLAREGIQPSPEADRYTLIRRLYLDLTGLLPSIAEVDAFVNDTRPDACEQLVERLLASPHYGERWGRWWLDLARYADSNGYSIDAPRSIWPYRDWVIRAMNRDLPFDQFVVEQLAGDMLPNATPDQVIATGFHRNTQINQEGGIDKEQFRIESVMDRVATTGTAFFGLTVACAQCHDHKFDPITQREYYEMFAFFNNQDEPTFSVPDHSVDLQAIQMEIQELEEELERHFGIQAAALAKEEGGLSDAARAKLKPDVRKALAVEPGKRTLKQKRLIHAALIANDQEFKALHTRLTELETGMATKITTLVMAERKEPRDSFFFIKGDFTRKGERVTPGVPAVLHPLQPVAAGARRLASRSEKDQSLVTAAAPERNWDRLDFARWVVSPENPLLARVTVNRVWQQYFGKGIVETENDFGTQGLPPTHPELLDWLACEFMAPRAAASSFNALNNATQAASASAWSLKHLHRLIVTSATYRQSSRARPELAAKDPNNRLLARQNRLRLDAEIVRDVALCASGLLNNQIGGPGVFPPQPDGVMSLGQVKRDWKADKGANRYRRGMYTFLFRATPHPALNVFDAPDAFSACTRRPRSNTPLQALTLLNDQAFFEFAGGLASRAAGDTDASDAAKIEKTFRLCLSRPPSPDEMKTLQGILSAEREAQRGKAGIEPWITVARVVLNLDETITRE